MRNPFTKTFFRFCAGFVALLALSFAVIAFSAAQGEGRASSAASAHS